MNTHKFALNSTRLPAARPYRGGRRAAAIYDVIVSARMNDVDPQAWLADVLARIAEHPVHKRGELLRWNWRSARASANLAA